MVCCSAEMLKSVGMRQTTVIGSAWPDHQAMPLPNPAVQGKVLTTVTSRAHRTVHCEWGCPAEGLDGEPPCWPQLESA